MDLGLQGSAAVVTGGSKGMGLAIAETLAAEGARVAVMARGRAGLDSAVEALRAAGAPDAVGVSVDMSDAASIAAGFATVADRWGELNSLVHTIGPSDGYFEDMGDAEWDAAFTLGTMSAVRSIRAALPMLRSAPWARTASWRRSRCVEPQPSLMFSPSGSAPMTTTEAPASRNASGEQPEAAPWAQSSTTVSPSRRCGRDWSRCTT